MSRTGFALLDALIAVCIVCLITLIILSVMTSRLNAQHLLMETAHESEDQYHTCLGNIPNCIICTPVPDKEADISLSSY